MALGWVAALGVAGCLIAQDDHLLDPLPPHKNQPPRIVTEEQGPPSRSVAATVGPGCAPLTFSAPVEDPDVGDLVVYEVYVDSTTTFVKQGTLANTELSRRAGAATFTASLDGSGPLGSPGEHVLELLVSDGQLINRVPQPRTVVLSDGGTALDPTYAVSTVWVVTVQGGSCP